MKPLREHNIDELIDAVDSGSDAYAQKSEPVLIAQASLHSAKIMADSLTTLNTNLADLDKKISSFTETSDKYTKRMLWLTAGLFFAATVQAMGILIQTGLLKL